MIEKIPVAVLGATGIVGQAFTWMLSRHDWFDLKVITASEKRNGKKYSECTRWLLPFEMPAGLSDAVLEEMSVELLASTGVKIVFSALPSELAATVEPELRSKGFYVFSNASALRYVSNVPILIPEVNPESLDLIIEQGYPRSGFVVTNANCSTTGLAVALGPLRDLGIAEVYVSTYQSVSGAGYPGLSSLDIAGNTIPFIKDEEEKMIIELRKILSMDMAIWASCVRVPVEFGHLETVWVKFKNEVSCEDVIARWAGSAVENPLPSGAKQPVVYNPDERFPQSRMSFYGSPPGMIVYTGRLRKVDGKIGFSLLVNNIIKGAAGGSIQNAELFINKYQGSNQ